MIGLSKTRERERKTPNTGKAKPKPSGKFRFHPVVDLFHRLPHSETYKGHMAGPGVSHKPPLRAIVLAQVAITKRVK